MSTELFRVRLARTQVHPDDLKWMPKWLDEYARFQRVSEGTLAVEQDGVLRFLRTLRDRGVSADVWQRAASQGVSLPADQGRVFRYRTHCCS